MHTYQGILLLCENQVINRVLYVYSVIFGSGTLRNILQVIKSYIVTIVHTMYIPINLAISLASKKLLL